MEIIETVDAKAPVKKKPTTKKVAGRGNPGKPKSKAHKDAISAALKAYHASKKKGKKKPASKNKKSAIDKAKATIKKAGGIIKNNGRLKAMTALDKKKRQKRLMDLQKIRTEIKNLQEKLAKLKLKPSRLKGGGSAPIKRRITELKAKAQKIRSGT